MRQFIPSIIATSVFIIGLQIFVDGQRFLGGVLIGVVLAHLMHRVEER